MVYLTRLARGNSRDMGRKVFIFAVFFTFLAMLPTGYAESVNLLEHTDNCIYNKTLKMDYCYSIYEICNYKTDNNFRFMFSKPHYGYSPVLNEMSYNVKTNETIIGKDVCKIIRIDAYKDPFINIDNVFCSDDKCYYEYAWWNTSFHYKSPVYINKTGSATHTNYTLEIDINSSFIPANFDYANECRDGNETRIRVLNSTEDGELPFWVGSCGTANATIYVNLLDNVTSNLTTIWLYYGSESADYTAGNSRATFSIYSRVFDDLAVGLLNGTIDLNSGVKWLLNADSTANVRVIDNGNCHSGRCITADVGTSRYVGLATPTGIPYDTFKILTWLKKADADLSYFHFTVGKLNSGYWDHNGYSVLWELEADGTIDYYNGGWVNDQGTFLEDVIPWVI